MRQKDKVGTTQYHCYNSKDKQEDLEDRLVDSQARWVLLEQVDRRAFLLLDSHRVVVVVDHQGCLRFRRLVSSPSINICIWTLYD